MHILTRYADMNSYKKWGRKNLKCNKSLQIFPCCGEIIFVLKIRENSSLLWRGSGTQEKGWKMSELENERIALGSFQVKSSTSSDFQVPPSSEMSWENLGKLFGWLLPPRAGSPTIFLSAKASPFIFPRKIHHSSSRDWKFIYICADPK